MRLVSFRQDGVERLGIERPDGRWLPTESLRGGGSLPGTMADLLAGGPAALMALRAAAEQAAARGADAAGIEPASVERLAPVPRPGKVVAVGLNYRDHAAEQNAKLPESPVLFAKFTTAVVGDGATIEWDPDLTASVDLEAELAVVIGRTARRVPAEAALDYVLGYTCLNDVSARDLQFADRQYVRAKSLDTFCPMGPALVTADEIPDPGRLAIRSFINGRPMQDSSTANLVFGVAELIAFCSRAFTLEPGDVIATGTPAGVGWFREPKVTLHDGDEVTIEIEGIGRLVNRCRETRRDDTGA